MTSSLALKDLLRRSTPSIVKRTVASIITSGIIGRHIRGTNQFISSKGCRIRIDSRRVSDQEVAALYFGLRERAEADIVDNALPFDNNVTVVELGTSIGYIASIVAKHRPRRLILVEPDAALLDIAIDNAILNGTAETEIVFDQVAINYSGEETVMFWPGSTTTSGKTCVDRPQANGQMVKATTLTRLLRKHRVEDYVLISDIEGAEVDIWFQDEQALTCCKAIVVELEDCNNRRITDQVERIMDLGFVESYSHGKVYCFKRPTISSQPAYASQ